MSASLANAAWSACHSALRLDRWMAGELPPAEAGLLAAHVAGCARCREAVASLEAARDRAVLPPLRTARVPRRRAPWTALGAGALATAVAVLLVRPGREGDDRPSGSAPFLSMFVRHGAELRRAGPGEVVVAGDDVRFAVTLRREAWVAVLALDPAGRARVCFPGGGRAEAIGPGTDVALPLATPPDVTPGDTRIFGLFCEGPLELEPVRARLSALASGPPPPGCQVTRWSFEKR